MTTTARRFQHSNAVSSSALYYWLLHHMKPAASITAAAYSCRMITTAASTVRPTLSSSLTRSVHLSINQHRRLPSHLSTDSPRTSTLQHRRKTPNVQSATHLPASELRALSEAAVKERRRRLAARHRDLSFLRKAPLLAASLPPSLAHIAPALRRTDFSYSWPCDAFRVVPRQQRSTEQTAYESRRQITYERHLRARKAEKADAINTLKQTLKPLQQQQQQQQHNTQHTHEATEQTYQDCLDAVKRIRQLYSPLLTPNDYYTLVLAAGLCVHERLLVRLLEDADIAGVRLPGELFARLLQLQSSMHDTAALRCVVVLVDEFARQHAARRAKDGADKSGRSSPGGPLPLSAEQYGRVMEAVSRMSSSHLLLPLLEVFRHSGSRASEDVPLVCTTVLPALRYLSHCQQHDVLLSFSSAVLHCEAVDAESEVWTGSQLSAVCELLQLHFDSLSRSQALTASAAVPDSWRARLPHQSELYAAVPALRHYDSADKHFAVQQVSSQISETSNQQRRDA